VSYFRRQMDNPDSFTWSTAWTVLVGGATALVLTLIATALALAGKISMSGAKYCLLAAWLISVLGFFGFPIILRQPIVLRLAFTGLFASALGICFHFFSEWMLDQVTTLDNVNSHVSKWAHALPDFLSGSRIEEGEGRADMHFGYAVIFSDGTGIAVSRNKDEWGRFITLATRLLPDGDFPAAFNNLSDSQKQRFIRDVGIEIVRAKIPVGNIDPTKPIEIKRRIPIDANLRDTAFYDSVREVHYWLRLIIDTESRLFAEMNDENK
jgi:hypothetical protein